MRIPWQLVFILILTWVITASCSTPRFPVTEVSDAKTTKESGESIILPEETVEFEGISFNYDANTFGQVKRELVPVEPLEEPDHKPDSVAPAHVRFTFQLGKEHSKAEIAVYPLDEFPKVYAVSPSMVTGMKEEITALKKVLTDESSRLNGDIPHLPYRDASDNFYVKVRHFDFENGKGVLFVTHWMHGADLISNRNLIYRYEGITADGKSYVTAEMPVSVDFLPDDTPDEFEGHTYENLYDFGGDRKAAEKRFDAYKNSIANRLEKLEPNDYSPNLRKFESMIASLRVDS